MNRTSDDGHQVAIDVGVCTFRRPELEKTLASLAAMAVPEGTTVRVVVADNDVTPSARPTVERAAAAMPFPVRYVHCPASNISLARNACLDAADADFLAFVDDDEVVTHGWLGALLRTASDTGADVVLGPVRALYGPDVPAWMRAADLHSTRPVWVSGTIRTGYTCNTLMRLGAPSIRGRRFNLALGRTGGEDTEFFTQVHEAGGRFAYAADAWIEEPVPDARASLAWLAKRRYRSGQTHGRLLRRDEAFPARGRNLALALAKVAFCAGASAGFGFSPRRRNVYALRGIMHAGVVGGLLGAQEIRQYGLTEVDVR